MCCLSELLCAIKIQVAIMVISISFVLRMGCLIARVDIMDKGGQISNEEYLCTNMVLLDIS